MMPACRLSWRVLWLVLLGGCLSVPGAKGASADADPTAPDAGGVADPTPTTPDAGGVADADPTPTTPDAGVGPQSFIPGATYALDLTARATNSCGPFGVEIDYFTVSSDGGTGTYWLSGCTERNVTVALVQSQGELSGATVTSCDGATRVILPTMAPTIAPLSWRMDFDPQRITPDSCTGAYHLEAYLP